MRVLVCGGRNYEDKDRVFKELNTLLVKEDVTIINGGATGADKFARDWARHGLKVCITVPPNWKLYGKRAGPIRNFEMLAYKPDLVLAFSGGKGTADMVKKARAAGVEVKEIK